MTEIKKEVLLNKIKELSDERIYYVKDFNGYTAKVLLEKGIYKVGRLSDIIANVAVVSYGVKDLGEYYPFRINGIPREANSFEELLSYVIYDFETIQLNDSKYYSAYEVHIIESIIRYQKDIGAELEMLKTKKGLTKSDVMDYSHIKIRHLLNKKVRKNKGIFYVPSLMGYTSTHLYNHFEKEKGNRQDGGCNYKRLRKFGDLKDIIPLTLWLYDKSKVRFYYPYKIYDVKGYCQDKEDLYRVVLESRGQGLELVNERVYYSRQTKRNIKYLLKSVNFEGG